MAHKSTVHTTRDSALTCPVCNYEETFVMSDDACHFFHTCNRCGTLLKPVGEDCCVFCSYGTLPCPPKQRERHP